MTQATPAVRARMRAYYRKQHHPACKDCGATLRKPSPARLCGFCREEKALSA